MNRVRMRWLGLRLDADVELDVDPELTLRQAHALAHSWIDHRSPVSLALMQYTPEIAAADERSLLLDISASLSLFGGHRKLSRRVQSSVRALGFSVCIGMAPTAHGAWLFAHSRWHGNSRQHRSVKLRLLLQ